MRIAPNVPADESISRTRDQEVARLVALRARRAAADQNPRESEELKRGLDYSIRQLEAELCKGIEPSGRDV